MRSLPRKPTTPRMTLEIIKAKTLRHNPERAWRKSRTQLDRLSSRYFLGSKFQREFFFFIWLEFPKTCWSCLYHIRDRIRKSLSLALGKNIAVALVSSKLDYWNSLFHNMPEKDIARLHVQRVQNRLAKVVTNATRFSRSVPILKQLHWLVFKFRIHFNYVQ